MAIEIERVDHLPSLPPRPRDSNKGQWGHLLAVAGSQGMIGAPSLLANAALRSGAGLVTVATPQTIQPFVAMLCPCATSAPLSVQGGDLSPLAVGEVLREAEKCSVLAVGPGMGVALPQRMVVRALLEQARPLVIDADGLNNLVHIAGWPALHRGPLVLTPHPGEMSRLTGRSVKEIQADREGSAEAALREWADQRTVQDAPLVLVLKGAGTIVTDGRRMYVNTTGNPGLATGGTGDVLTGVIAALIGQGLSPFDAAVLGVYVHGAAGDAAAARLGQVSLIATDVVDYLPHAFTQVQRT